MAAESTGTTTGGEAAGAMYVRTLQTEAASAFRSTVRAQGAWNEHEQHMGPASGLLAHEIDRFTRDAQEKGLRIARISYDILGLIPGGDVTVELAVERPGRTIQLVRAEMTGADGRPCIRARAWLLVTSDTSAAAGLEDEPMPPLKDCRETDGSAVWPGGYIAQLRLRQHPSARPGRGQTWVSSSFPLVEGEAAPFGEFIRDLDAANGMVTRTRPMGGGYAFPNVDLQVHLLRAPEGEWKGLDTRVSFGADGVGLTSSTVHDAAGVVGHLEQTLTVRRVGA